MSDVRPAFTRSEAAVSARYYGSVTTEHLDLCVPKTLSTSCDQAIFVDQATDAGLPSDVGVLKVDQFG